MPNASWPIHSPATAGVCTELAIWCASG
ncbi:Peptide synthase, partial [Pseudomonas syringae pv. papulans]